MTRGEFIEILEEKSYSYEMSGDKILVIGGSGPDGRFDVILNKITSLPPDVVFNNKMIVYLGSLKSIPLGVEFNNGGDIYLESVKSISPGVVFNNKGRYINLESLVGGWLGFLSFDGIIEGIDHKKILNKMISDGVFDRG